MAPLKRGLVVLLAAVAAADADAGSEWMSILQIAGGPASERLHALEESIQEAPNLEEETDMVEGIMHHSSAIQEIKDMEYPDEMKDDMMRSLTEWVTKQALEMPDSTARETLLNLHVFQRELGFEPEQLRPGAPSKLLLAKRSKKEEEFAFGETVQMQDDDNDKWYTGMVSSVDPLEVTFIGGHRGYPWARVRKDPSATQTAVAKPVEPASIAETPTTTTTTEATTTHWTETITTTAPTTAHWTETTTAVRGADSDVRIAAEIHGLTVTTDAKVLDGFSVSHEESWILSSILKSFGDMFFPTLNK